MRTHLFFLTLLLPFMAVAAEKGTVPLPKDYEPPAISLQQAVKKAEQCLVDRKVDVSKSYLYSAVFEYAVLVERKGKDHGRYWTVRWRMNQPTPEGSTTVMMYEDSTCFVSEGNAPLR